MEHPDAVKEDSPGQAYLEVLRDVRLDLRTEIYS